MGHSFGTGRFIASLQDSGPLGVRVQGDCVTASAIALPFRLSSAPGIGATISYIHLGTPNLDLSSAPNSGRPSLSASSRSGATTCHPSPQLGATISNVLQHDDTELLSSAPKLSRRPSQTTCNVLP